MRNVILRAYEYQDTYDMLSWMNDADSVKYLGNGFTRKLSLDEGYARIGEMLDGEYTGSCFVIADADTDEYLGECNLMLPDLRAKKAEISCVLKPAARGHGAAYAALFQLIRYAFTGAGFERLTLKCVDANAPALRLYKRLGFKTEGVLRKDIWADGCVRDVVCMGLLKNEWSGKENGGTESKK